MELDKLKILIQKVTATAKKAGAFIREEGRGFTYENAQIKGLNDLVSYVDKGAEEIIVKELSEAFGEAGFIAEENTRAGKKEYNWIVDPLDGTTNFIHGIPCYSVSIALERNNEILAGVVYEVSRGECFSAVKGGGAFLNEQQIKVSSRKSLSESLIATGFPIYNFSRLDDYLKVLTYFMQHTHGLRRIGSAATDLCYLACGRVDAFFEYNLQPWDVAAGGLIVKEAGGTINDFSGKDNWIFGKEASATNALLYEAFNKIVADHFNS